MGRATHSNIVQLHEINEDAGFHYMALEYVDGWSLRDFVARKGPPDVALAISIIGQAASALHRASELGIIHRDIKPENILLSRAGEVKVADFGLSRVLVGDQPLLKLTQSGVTMGTPQYMSPEQVEGKAVDGRTDIYSLGVTAYTMMTGSPPFHGATPFEVALQHVQKDPRPLASIRPDLPEALCAVIHKMMAKDPDRRYQTGRELQRELSHLGESLGSGSGQLPARSLEGLTASDSTPVSEAATPMAEKPRGQGVTKSRPPGRRRWILGLAGASLLCAAGAGMAISWLWHRDAATDRARPTDGPEAALVQAKREQALVEAAEESMREAGKLPRNPSRLDGCVNLGTFYLDQHRLDDAAMLFARLEGFEEARDYFTLGKLGRAIVLALRSQPGASNKLFHEVFPPQPAARMVAEQILKGSARLRFWFAEAVHYNKVNGIQVRELQWLNDLPDQLRQELGQP